MMCIVQLNKKYINEPSYHTTVLSYLLVEVGFILIISVNLKSCYKCLQKLHPLEREVTLRKNFLDLMKLHKQNN